MDLQSGYPFSLIRYGLPYAYPKLTEPVAADVLIIGGGISGALTAYYLTEAGLDCVVTDSRTIGLGSTCASTSLLQYEIDVPLSELILKTGYQNAVRAYTLCRESIATLATLAEKVHVKEFQFNKSLYYAAYKKDMAFLREEFECRKRNGFAVDLLTPHDITKEFNFSAPAAILSQDGAYVDAYLLTHGLHQHGIKKGLSVFDRTHIKKVISTSTGAVATTAEGMKIKTKYVVYATGYEVTKDLPGIVKLHSTYVTVSESMPEARQFIKKDVMMWNTGDPYLYMRETPDDRIIVGGRDEAFYNPTKRDSLIGHKSKLLARDYQRLFPDIPFRSEFSWTGTFGTTADGLPFIGTHPRFRNRYFALGFGGNGITFSVIAAAIIRDILTGKKNHDQEIFSFERI
jgi:glycine/D-amino acid oxidase-like deaminating enzyme